MAPQVRLTQNSWAWESNYNPTVIWNQLLLDSSSTPVFTLVVSSGEALKCWDDHDEMVIWVDGEYQISELRTGQTEAINIAYIKTVCTIGHFMKFLVISWWHQCNCNSYNSTNYTQKFGSWAKQVMVIHRFEHCAPSPRNTPSDRGWIWFVGTQT